MWSSVPRTGNVAGTRTVRRGRDTDVDMDTSKEAKDGSQRHAAARATAGRAHLVKVEAHPAAHRLALAARPPVELLLDVVLDALDDRVDLRLAAADDVDEEAGGRRQMTHAQCADVLRLARVGGAHGGEHERSGWI
eukprot:1560057-Prymnesium_polylepis.1